MSIIESQLTGFKTVRWQVDMITEQALISCEINDVCLTGFCRSLCENV